MTKVHPTVYAFLDESGDAGGNVRKGASPHFVLAMVETTNPEQLRAELRRLRVALHLPATFEFRYHDTRKVAVRAAFFVLLRSLDLRVRAAIVDKARLPEDFDYKRQGLYSFVVGELVMRAPMNELQDAILIVDGKGGAPTANLVRGLRIHLTRLCTERERPFRKIVARNSSSEDGLQFADMVAGVLAERF
ncbi:MAG: DUF3800 domain-containing protein, partial [Chloroflexota bacterium]